MTVQDVKTKAHSNRLRLQIPGNVRYALTVVLLLLLMNTLLRTVFLLYNTDQARAMTWTDILLGYSVGFRFDLATILIFNGIILLFLALPLAIHRRRSTYRICNILLVLANMPILVVNAIDVVYYSFAEKRLTHELFTTQSDFGSFKPSLLAEYWWLFLLFFTMTVVMYKVLNFFALRYVLQSESRPLSRRWLWSGTFVVCMYFGMNGGWQSNPLAISNAYVGESFFSGSMGLNSAYTILTAVDWQRQEAMRNIPEAEAIAVTRSMLKHPWDSEYLRTDYPLLRKTHFVEPERHYNVVFLIIESLNARDIGILNGAEKGKSLTPNLDTLARHARVYNRYFANGTRSVESLPALLNSIPDIFGRPTIGSHFINNTHYGLPMILGERGYETSFFCGSHNGTMGFDKYAAASGISQYFGMNEYPYSERDFDGYWGCADGPFMQWMAVKQQKMKEPFMSVLFTISNHHPFNLPKDAGPEISRLPVSRMQKTVKYTDQALGAYFQEVRKQAWSKNTIFIITGDHCFHEHSDPERTFVENFQVPLFLIGPEIEPGMDDRIGQHISIMPTLISHMRLRTLHASTGVSLLGEAPKGFAINNLMDVASLVQGDLALSSSFEKVHAVCHNEGRRWLKVYDGEVSDKKKLEMEYKLRCLFQVYHNTRIKNKLHYRPWHPISHVF
jgi:phosphoglycerol transferase MdoB-like AlkP superfamily enzyme